ncbi:MAG: hypothetical protein EBS01_07090, partial [Verrucomicrobia bacterium]|nr:hypothetical protein [Verrucomicrobiota bacterium]
MGVASRQVARSLDKADLSFLSSCEPDEQYSAVACEVFLRVADLEGWALWQKFNLKILALMKLTLKRERKPFLKKFLVAFILACAVMFAVPAPTAVGATASVTVTTGSISISNL